MFSLPQIQRPQTRRGLALYLAAAVMAGAAGATAQTVDVGGRPAAAGAPAGAGASFVISRTIGLGRLKISSLTGGLVRNAVAPKAATGGGGGQAQTATATDSTETTETTETADADATAEFETAELIESSIETIQQTTITTDTQTTETTFAAIEPTPTPEPTPEPTSDDDGGGNDSHANNGVGNGEGGGKEGNRGIGKKK